MAWRDQLTQTSFFIDGRSVQLVGGSYKGQSFRTVGAELKVGRRNVVNEYPQRDVPYVDDLGRRARRFVVEAYVIGPNYLQERDALVEAFESAGPGELSHPRWGIVNVSIDGEVSVKESPEQGGMARISVTFVEDGPNTFPSANTNTVAQVERAANAADDAFELQFAKTFNVSGASVLSVNGIKALTRGLAGVLALAQRATSVAGLASVVGLVGGLTGSLADLIRIPTVLVQSLRSVFAQLVQNLAKPLMAFAELQSIFKTNKRSPAMASAASSLARSQVNDMAVADLNRRLSLSNQARVLAVAVSSSSVVATAAQASILRNSFLQQMDEEIEVNESSDEVTRVLVSLRAAVVRDVALRSQLLLQKSGYTSTSVLPAVVLAHRIYQDANRAEELVLRNGVKHPAFVSAQTFEVLR